jgi:hypothetical protein
MHQYMLVKIGRDNPFSRFCGPAGCVDRGVDVIPGTKAIKALTQCT